MLLDYDPVPSFTASVISFAVIAAVVYVLYNRATLHGPFPPGPWKIPLLGNILNLTFSCPWALSTQWKSEYGAYNDIVHIDNHSQSHQIINITQILVIS